jgi:hypothetical protein
MGSCSLTGTEVSAKKPNSGVCYRDRQPACALYLPRKGAGRSPLEYQPCRTCSRGLIFNSNLTVAGCSGVAHAIRTDACGDSARSMRPPPPRLPATFLNEAIRHHPDRRATGSLSAVSICLSASIRSAGLSCSRRHASRRAVKSSDRKTVSRIVAHVESGLDPFAIHNVPRRVVRIELSYRFRGGLQPSIANGEHRHCGDKADEADDHERRDVGSPGGACHTGGKRGDGAAQLMAREDPSDDDRRLRGAEMLRR